MSKNQTGYTVTRKQILKKGGSTPDFIDQSIPTDPINLRFGPGRGIGGRAASGSAWLMGSKTLQGSPLDFMYQLTRMRVTTSTPNVYFALVHSRKTGGTFDTLYMPSRGDDLTVGDLETPLYSLLPGTLKAYALGPGSSISQGKGSTVRFQGLGSFGAFAVGWSADLYPV